MLSPEVLAIVLAVVLFAVIVAMLPRTPRRVALVVSPAALAVVLVVGHIWVEPEPDLLGRTVLIESGGTISAGIIWDRNTVVTTAHGLVNSSEITMTGRDGPLEASLLHADPYSDVALLHVHSGYAEVEGADARQGMQVYAVGHPSGRPWGVTAGVVSSVERHEPVSLQHDAALSTGSSGGPLLDSTGRLLGMNAAIDDLGFAIPYGTLRHIVERVGSTGQYTPGCLGAGIDSNGTVMYVRDRMEGLLETGDTVLSVDGLLPYNLVFARDPGETVRVVTTEGSFEVALGSMELWFGIHTCR